MHNYVYFEDLANLMARRAALTTPPPLAIIDSHPQRGSLTDPRMCLTLSRAVRRGADLVVLCCDLEYPVLPPA